MGRFRAIVVAVSIAVSGCAGSSSSPSAPSGSVLPLTAPIEKVLVVGTPPVLGTSSQFTAIAVGPDGSNQTITAQATWLSSNTSIATVNNGGMVTAISNGSVEISAVYANTKGSLTFAVVPRATFALNGTVTDATSGGGLAAATVTLKDALGGSKSAVTDSAGRYSIAGLIDGSVDVTAVAPDHVPVTRSIRMFADTTLNFSLPRTAACPLIGFDELQPHEAVFTTHTSCGFTVRATTSNWTVSTGYGRPAPFIQFRASAGTTTVGEVMVTAAGVRFTFQSVDVYSSTTPIPYVITGIANSTTVFSIQNTQGNTFGNFATVLNPQQTAQIDALLIRLSNPAAPCCGNPMGLDNIRVTY